jgi:pyridoxal phosphate enzyme, yggS family
MKEISFIDRNDMIKENIKKIRDDISAACKKYSRDESEVKLIAVSKTMPVDILQEAYDCGIRDFGENKVQELVSKSDLLPDDIRWHMIGHLQTNKVKAVIKKAALIHSVDSLKLAEVIEYEASKLDISVEGLLEVNVANEESKFGFGVLELLDQIEAFEKFKHLKIRGLMTVAPYVEDPKCNESVFKKLKNLSVDINERKFHNTKVNLLSMGMSNDYEIAISQGATFIRVGTAIFGARGRK